MKKNIIFLCVLCLSSYYLAATEDSTTTPQQKNVATSNETINQEMKQASDFAMFAMDAFVLTTCAALEKCEYTRGYGSCLLDFRLEGLRCINTAYAKSLLCRLYVWFEKTAQILQDAHKNGQNTAKVPTLDFSTQDIEIKLDEQIKRIHDGEAAAGTEKNEISRFFPFNTTPIK